MNTQVSWKHFISYKENEVLWIRNQNGELWESQWPVMKELNLQKNPFVKTNHGLYLQYFIFFVIYEWTQ
jgi:hypothetical protein